VGVLEASVDERIVIVVAEVYVSQPQCGDGLLAAPADGYPWHVSGEEVGAECLVFAEVDGHGHVSGGVGMEPVRPF
jgi:hypothetical protein